MSIQQNKDKEQDRESTLFEEFEHMLLQKNILQPILDEKWKIFCKLIEERLNNLNK